MTQKLYYNRATGVIGLTPKVTTSIAKLTRKRYSTMRLDLVPVDAAGEISLYEPGASGLLVVKETGAYTGAATLLDSAWTPLGVSGSGYEFALTVSSAALTTSLGTEAKKPFALEIVIDHAGGRDVLPTISLEVENNYWREDDPPDPVEDPYPLPGALAQLDIAIGTNARLSSTHGLQIRDTVSGVWRSVTFEDGAITYTQH